MDSLAIMARPRSPKPGPKGKTASAPKAPRPAAKPPSPAALKIELAMRARGWKRPWLIGLVQRKGLKATDSKLSKWVSGETRGPTYRERKVYAAILEVDEFWILDDDRPVGTEAEIPWNEKSPPAPAHAEIERRLVQDAYEIGLDRALLVLSQSRLLFPDDPSKRDELQGEKTIQKLPGPPRQRPGSGKLPKPKDQKG